MKLKLFIILIAITLFASCEKVHNPTGAIAPEDKHPNQIIIEDFTECFAKALGVDHSITVYYFEETRVIWEKDAKKCAPRPAPCDMYVVGGGWPGGKWVEYWGPWVRDEHTPIPPPNRNSLAETASHEVCHVSGIMNEIEAALCSQRLVASGVCP